MPKKKEEMVRAIMRTGKSKDSAWAIATAQMAKGNKNHKKKH